MSSPNHETNTSQGSVIIAVIGVVITLIATILSAIFVLDIIAKSTDLGGSDILQKATVTVVVVGSNEMSISNALVSLHLPGQSPIAGFTDQSGITTFEIGNLEPNVINQASLIVEAGQKTHKEQVTVQGNRTIYIRLE